MIRNAPLAAVAAAIIAGGVLVLVVARGRIIGAAPARPLATASPTSI